MAWPCHQVNGQQCHSHKSVTIVLNWKPRINYKLIGHLHITLAGPSDNKFHLSMLAYCTDCCFVQSSDVKHMSVCFCKCGTTRGGDDEIVECV